MDTDKEILKDKHEKISAYLERITKGACKLLKDLEDVKHVDNFRKELEIAKYDKSVSWVDSAFLIYKTFYRWYLSLDVSIYLLEDIHEDIENKKHREYIKAYVKVHAVVYKNKIEKIKTLVHFYKKCLELSFFQGSPLYLRELNTLLNNFPGRRDIFKVSSQKD